MKNSRILLLMLAVLTIFGCGNKEKKSEIWVAPEHEAVTRQMPEYHLMDSTQSGGHTYCYEINRMPSDSLPMVIDDMEDLYRDNTIRLTLQRDGITYFDKTFTKSVFASSIDETFYENAILDGIRFIRAEPGQGLTFSIAVSYPESDMSMPFLLTITDQGTFSFVKDDTLDVEEIGDSGNFNNDGV